jgi:hypothetical protein
MNGYNFPKPFRTKSRFFKSLLLIAPIIGVNTKKTEINTTVEVISPKRGKLIESKLKTPFEIPAEIREHSKTLPACQKSGLNPKILRTIIKPTKSLVKLEIIILTIKPSTPHIQRRIGDDKINVIERTILIKVVVLVLP